MAPEGDELSVHIGPAFRQVSSPNSLLHQLADRLLLAGESAAGAPRTGFAAAIRGETALRRIEEQED